MVESRESCHSSARLERTMVLVKVTIETRTAMAEMQVAGRGRQATFAIRLPLVRMASLTPP